MKVLEVRASLLAKDDDGRHVKHVSVVINDPVLCDVIARAVGSRLDLDKVPDAHSETIEAEKKKEPAA
jgi:hypothetical protein